MRRILSQLVAAFAIVVSVTSMAAGQVVQGTGVASTLRVTVLDPTEAALVIAQVTVVDARGAERTAAVDERGVAVFENLVPGNYQVKATADSFRPIATPFNVRRGDNRTTLRLALATIEQSVVVQDQSAAERRDNGFTQTLTQDQIDSLPDDPDEMADELMRMAGPGAQIFVNGFRGGRLPPKDQIQQIRFHTNSFSSEYHEAGMIRIEVITKPGMGGWRGQTNFGFRDESLNAKNYFAEEKGAEQMRRYMLNFQGPIVKGKTGLTMSFDGNSSYDSRTINAQAPSGAPITGLAETPTDAMNFNARVEHLMGPTSQLQLEYSRRQNDRSNLGVGDFDLPERAYAADNSTDTFRVRSTNVIGKKVFSEFRFSLIESTLSTTSQSQLPTVRVNEAFNAGGAGQMGDRHARELEIAQNFDFSMGRKHSMRAGLLFEAAGGTARSARMRSAPTPLRAWTLSTPDRRPPMRFASAIRSWITRRSRPAGSCRMTSAREDRCRSASVFARNPDAGRQQVEFRAARGDDVECDEEDHGARRLRHLLRLVRLGVYEQTIRVDGTHQIDVIVQNPGFPVLEGGGARLPASVIRAASLDQPSSSRPRSAWSGRWQRGPTSAPTTCGPRQQHLAIGQRQRAGERRASGSVGGNITELQSTGSAPRIASPSR
jgi:hypothetical protein